MADGCRGGGGVIVLVGSTRDMFVYNILKSTSRVFIQLIDSNISPHLFLAIGHIGQYSFMRKLPANNTTCHVQGRSVPYARTQVLSHRFDNLKKKKKKFRFYS